MPPPPPEILEVECSTIQNETIWAIAQYPGLLVENLYNVRAIGRTDYLIPWVPFVADMPGWYTDFPVHPILRDGAAAVSCGPISGPYFTSVVFLRV